MAKCWLSELQTEEKIGVKEGAELVSSDISLDGVVYEKLYVAVSGI